MKQETNPALRFIGQTCKIRTTKQLQDAKNGECPNNISVILSYSLAQGATALWMGDLETAFMEAIEDELTLPLVDILFAPHHGRDSGRIPSSMLEAMSPRIIVSGRRRHSINVSRIS